MGCTMLGKKPLEGQTGTTSELAVEKEVILFLLFSIPPRGASMLCLQSIEGSTTILGALVGSNR